MTDLPNWLARALDVFHYVFVVPLLVIYAVICVGMIIFVIAHPIWVAIRGHYDNDTLHSITRIVLVVIAVGVLWSVIAPLI